MRSTTDPIAAAVLVLSQALKLIISLPNALSCRQTLVISANNGGYKEHSTAACLKYMNARSLCAHATASFALLKFTEVSSIARS